MRSSFKLSEFFPSSVVRDGAFSQTQFANTKQPNSLGLVTDERYLKQVNDNPNITSVIANKELHALVSSSKAVAVSPEPLLAFYQLHNKLALEHGAGPAMEFGIHPTAQIHPSAMVSSKVQIGPNVFIGAGAIIESFSIIAENCRIDAGAIIGAEGHFFKKIGGQIFKVEHAGGVKIGVGVQVLSGALVSKAVHADFTEIGDHSVLSLQSLVGHGCQIGTRCILAGRSQVAGYTTLGDDVWIGPGAIIGNLLSIGNKARVEIGSVVIADVAPGANVSGNFAISHVKNIRDYAGRNRPS